MQTPDYKLCKYVVPLDIRFPSIIQCFQCFKFLQCLIDAGVFFIPRLLSDHATGLDGKGKSRDLSNLLCLLFQFPNDPCLNL